MAKNNNEKKEPARAPYNFISFPNKVVTRYESELDVPKFDIFRDDLNTGYIDFEFTNETDLFVGGQKKKNDTQVEFFTNAKGDICIPGSSMRGVIRKNCEILSFSYPEFIEDRKYLYRNFAGEKGAIKKEYTSIIKIKEKGDDISDVVKVGYIYKDEHDYKLIPVKEINGKCFRLISEKKLRAGKDKKGFEISEKDISYMYTKELLNFKSKIKKDKQTVDRMDENEKKQYDKALKNEWKKHLKKYENSYYRPYNKSVTFDIDYEKDEINDIKVYGSKKKYKNKGVLFNSNHLNQKIKHYLIYDIDSNKEYVIEDDIILDYKKDVDMFSAQRNGKGKKTPEDYYDLPKEIGREHKKIFFYKLEDDKVKYFGKAPYLRISYKNSQKELVKTIKPSVGLDYAKSMFGYTSDYKDKHNLKSRISFMDIVCESPNVDTKEYSLILSSPKPTSQQLYLKQDSNDPMRLKTYNQGKSELRGYKFYWNKEINKKDTTNPQSSITTNINNVIKPNNKFKSRIYFENLTNDELGLLLLGIKFNGDCKESIGMGKPYGYGRIDIENIDLYLEYIDIKFIDFDNNYIKVDNKEIYITKFKEYMNSKIGKDYTKEDCIKEYIKSKTCKKYSKDVSYMEISKSTGIYSYGKEIKENEFNKLGYLPKALDIE